MSIFEFGVYVGLVLAVLFLISGLAILIFGRKTLDNSTNTHKLEFNIGGQSLSMPYNVNLAICGVGALLLFLTFDLIKEAGVEDNSRSSVTVFGFVTPAYAQTESNSRETPGWVYFGYEKNPARWNFEIMNGGYGDLMVNRKGLLLRSKREVNIRESHFGNFTGTILGFIDPAPPIIGTLPEGSCITVEAVKSVGFSKIWLDAVPAKCPEF